MSLDDLLVPGLADVVKLLDEFDVVDKSAATAATTSTSTSSAEATAAAAVRAATSYKWIKFRQLNY